MDSLLDRDQYEALKTCVYLNQASLGLVPRRATEAMVDFLENTAQHGNVRMSDAAEANVLDSLRSSIADLLDAPTDAVAVTGGASEGLSQLATMLASGKGEVVLVPTDFPCVTYPWLSAQERLGMKVVWVADNPDTDLTDDLIERITASTTVVCVSSVQYATGTLVDIRRVASRAHEVGAVVIADVTQMAGATPVSMRDCGADAIVCSGYKWLSAHGGVAALLVGERLLELVPHIVGWKGTVDPFDFDARTLNLAGSGRRFELSTMSYCSAVGLTASLELLREAGLARMESHAKTLRAELVGSVAEHGWLPFREVSAPSASSHIVSLRHPTLSIPEVQSALATSHKLVVSARGGGIRVSLHGYNNSYDVQLLSEALGDLRISGV